MKTRQFLIQSLVFLAIFTVYNRVVTVAARRAPARIVLRKIDQSPAASYLFAGNSLMQVGFDDKVFRQLRPRETALDVGLGGTMPPEHYLLIKRGQTSRAKELYYGFIDRLMTDVPPDGWSDIQSNRGIMYYANLEQGLPLYTRGNPFKAWQFRISSHLPVIVDRTQIWANAEKFRRKIEDVGMPVKAVNSLGRVADFAFIEDQNVPGFAVDCQMAAEQKVPFEDSMQRIFDLNKSDHIRVTVVLMPMPSRHRRLYYNTKQWRQYLEHVRNMTREQNARFVDASTWVKDGFFIDNVHLSPEGATVFTRRLLSGHEK